MATHTITVDVDANGNLTYQDSVSGKKSCCHHVNNGDSIIWTSALGALKITFRKDADPTSGTPGTPITSGPPQLGVYKTGSVPITGRTGIRSYKYDIQAGAHTEDPVVVLDDFPLETEDASLPARSVATIVEKATDAFHSVIEGIKSAHEAREAERKVPLFFPNGVNLISVTVEFTGKVDIKVGGPNITS